jgi:UDP-2-acetamido-3-amino-2,3-dideoxy-glucuronate N-acetyltransferase
MSVHHTAEVSDAAVIGPGTRIWHQAQVREGARVGANCVVGKGAYIDVDVDVGDNVRIQNGAFLYQGCSIEDGVFIGPGVCFTNDKRPRAINLDGGARGPGDWEVGRIVVRYGASLGCGAIILPDVTIGRHAMIAAGAVVSRDVPDYGFAMGVPARIQGFVCACGFKLMGLVPTPDVACAHCSLRYRTVQGVRGLECQPLR